jgi:hypothetical protein
MKVFRLITGFLIVGVLSACHPSAADKQDVHNGMNSLTYALSPDMSVEIYEKISHLDEIDQRSPFFKAGRDYLLTKTTYQLHRTIEMNRLGDFNGTPPPQSFAPYENMELKQRLSALFATTSVALRQDLAAIPMTPEAFGKLVGDDEVPKMMAMKPFPPDF